MGSKIKSFDEFYFFKAKSVLGISKIIDYAEVHEGDISPYVGNMLCPECKQAKLSFVHQTSKRCAHLRTSKGSEHEKMCSYNYEPVSTKDAVKYVNSLTYKEIQDKLNSILNMLFRKPAETSGVEKGDIVKKKNPMLVLEGKNGRNFVKTMRRKSLNAWMDFTDCEEYYIFYGKVKLKTRWYTKKDKNKPYYFLDVYTKRKDQWIYRASIYRASHNDYIDEKSIYCISMFGHLELKNGRKTIQLANQNAIQYRKMV